MLDFVFVYRIKSKLLQPPQSNMEVARSYCGDMACNLGEGGGVSTLRERWIMLKKENIAAESEH